MTTVDGKKLIANFIGLVNTKDSLRMLDEWKCTDKTPFNLQTIISSEMEDETWYVSHLRFDESWDWLMPVVNEIKRMESDPKECFMGTTLERKLMFDSVTNLSICTTIEFVFEKIIEFIEWYQNEKDKS